VLNPEPLLEDVGDAPGTIWCGAEDEVEYCVVSASLGKKKKHESRKYIYTPALVG